MIVNGNFDSGTSPWVMSGSNAQVTGAYGFLSAPFALALTAQYGFGPKAGNAHQLFAVGDGDVLEGWMSLAEDTTSAASLVEISYGGVLKYSIDSESMVVGEWARFEVPFDGADAAKGPTGKFEIKTVLSALPGPFSGRHRFLFDNIQGAITTMLAESLMKWLEDEGFGTEGTDLFLAHLPEQPDDCVAVYDEPTPVFLPSQGLAMDNFGVRVVVRNKVYTEARNKAVDIHKKLLGFSGLFVPASPEITMVDVMQSPSSEGRDEEGKRAVWSARYQLLVVSTGDQFRS